MLERERELHALGAALEAASDGSGALVFVEAPAGLGKTTLLRHAFDDARRREFVLVQATGSELEQGFPFGVARQLFQEPLRRLSAARRRQALSGPARMAAVALEVIHEEDALPVSGELYPFLHGLYWLTADLAGRGPPLVIGVDDAQWADQESLSLLLFLGRRLEGLSVAVIVAARPTADAATLDALRALDDSVHLPLAELSEEAVRAVLTEEFDTEPEQSFVERCRKATGGNPFFVRELARALHGTGSAPTQAHAHALEGTAVPTIARSVSRRIENVGGTRQVAEAVAVLGDRAPLSLVARLAAIGEQQAADRADALAHAGILVSGPELRFAHPVIRTAVYEEMGAARRAEAHSHAADLLLDGSYPPERIAAHVMLASAAGDQRRVEALRAAAHAARSRGASAVAVAHLKRALDEPPPAEKLQEVLVELGAARVAAGDWAGRREIEQALELAQSPNERAYALRELVKCFDLYFEGPETRELLWREIDELQRTHRELALQLEAVVAASVWVQPSEETLASVGSRLERVTANLAGRSPAERALLILAAGQRWQREEIAAPDAVDLVGEALRPGLPPDPATWLISIALLNSAERFDLSLPAIEQALADAVVRGQVTSFAMAMIGRADAMWIQGELRAAEADTESARTALEGGVPGIEAQPRALLVLSLIDQDRLDEAEAAIAPFQDQLGTDPPGVWFGPLLWARGCLRLAQMRFDEAFDDLRRVGANPAGAPSRELWRPAAVEALLGAGRTMDALELAHEAVEFAATHAPWHRGLAFTALGRARGRDGVEALEQAVEILENSAARLIRAKALLALGGLLRRSRRPADARDPLMRALEIAHECHAHRVQGQALQELRAAGLRPRRIARTGVESLTASELRVAQLAARGLSNPQIAQSLFVTRRTVETHLTHIYGKLDVKSRHELAADEQLTASDTSFSG